MNGNYAEGASFRLLLRFTLDLTSPSFVLLSHVYLVIRRAVGHGLTFGAVEERRLRGGGGKTGNCKRIKMDGKERSTFYSPADRPREQL